MREPPILLDIRWWRQLGAHYHWKCRPVWPRSTRMPDCMTYTKDWKAHRPLANLASLLDTFPYRQWVERYRALYSLRLRAERFGRLDSLPGYYQTWRLSQQLDSLDFLNNQPHILRLPQSHFDYYYHNTVVQRIQHDIYDRLNFYSTLEL